MRRKKIDIQGKAGKAENQTNNENHQSTATNNSPISNSTPEIKPKNKINEGFEDRVINTIKEGLKEGLKEGFKELVISVNNGFEVLANKLGEKLGEKIDNGFEKLARKLDDRFNGGYGLNFEYDKNSSIRSQSKKIEEISINAKNFVAQNTSNSEEKGIKNGNNSLVNYDSRDYKNDSNNTGKSNGDSYKEYQQKYENISGNDYSSKKRKKNPAKNKKLDEDKKEDEKDEKKVKNKKKYQDDFEEDEKSNKKKEN